MPKSKANRRSRPLPHMEWEGLTILLDENVYEPHEDSFLLAEAARKHAFGEVLDLGCGSGIVGLSALQSQKTEKLTLADLSEKAIALAKKNAQRNNPAKKPIQILQTDLFSNIHARFDTICFNPPYLPTNREEKMQGKINKAFDGGADGRKIIDRFLQSFEKYLKPYGILLLLNSSVSAKDGLSGNRITQKMLQTRGFCVETLTSERFFFEELVVLKANK